jgi:hypothetical protein
MKTFVRVMIFGVSIWLIHLLFTQAPWQNWLELITPAETLFLVALALLLLQLFWALAKESLSKHQAPPPPLPPNLRPPGHNPMGGTASPHARPGPQPYAGGHAAPYPNGHAGIPPQAQPGGSPGVNPGVQPGWGVPGTPRPGPFVSPGQAYSGQGAGASPRQPFVQQPNRPAHSR